MKVFEGDQAGVKTVLHVVDGVGDIVGPVHDLGLQARAPGRGAVPDPGEDLGVFRVGAKFAGGSGGSSPRASRVSRTAGEPGVLEGGVQGGAGQVQAGPAYL